MSTLGWSSAFGLAIVAIPLTIAAQTPLHRADVVYIPTASDIVAAMLDMARLTKEDVVYDLGAGDGRIVITAVKEYGAARGVGVELDPGLVAEANANAAAAGVSDRVRIIQGNVLDVDVRDATVVTLFMSTAINLKLRPRLLAQMAPGSRVVSHAFDMGDWKPAKQQLLRSRPLYLWRIPPRR